AENLGGFVIQSITDRGQRAGEAFVNWPLEHLAQEAFPRDAKAQRTAQSLEFLQPGQELQIVFRRLAKADAGIEHDPWLGYTAIGQISQPRLEELCNVTNDIVVVRVDLHR